jgi:hypothetical protein
MSIRRTDAIVAIIEGTTEGAWSSEQDITVVRGNTASDELVYTDGYPVITSPGLADVVVKFWADSVGGTEIDSAHANWAIGDQNLSEIITVTNLQDTDAGFTVDLQVNTSGITQTELVASALYDSTADPPRLSVIVSAEIDQPDA